MNDNDYIKIAIDISKKSAYPYGAIIVKNNRIIGRSDADTRVLKSAFSHAELIALEQAMPHLGGYLCAEGGKDCTLYSSCEPCAMCMGAILYAGIGRLIYSATLEDSAECVNEILAPCVKISKICKNRKIKIIKNFKREESLKVLKEWKEKNK